MKKKQKYVKFKKKELGKTLERMRELVGSMGRNAEALKEGAGNLRTVKTNILGATIEIQDLLEKFK